MIYIVVAILQMSCWRMDQSPSCLPQEQFAPLNFQDDNQPEVHYNPWLDLVTGDAYGQPTPNLCVVFMFSTRESRRNKIVHRGI